MSYRIEAHAEGEPTRSVELARASRVKIGRAPENDLVLDDAPGARPVLIPGGRQPRALISRLHAEVELGPDGGVTVRDLGSGSGTELRGSLVRQEPWHPGEPLKIGRWPLSLLKR